MLNLVLLTAANLTDDDEEAMVRYFFNSPKVLLFIHAPSLTWNGAYQLKGEWMHDPTIQEASTESSTTELACLFFLIKSIPNSSSVYPMHPALKYKYSCVTLT